jgi:hypothetical protein
MKITRLRLENFKRFRAPVEIGDLGAGLNLFAAPNEAGKSTIAAAIRTAFLERHKTGTLDALRPWSDPGASPAVEVDFEFGGTSYALAKSFLGRKRCDLRIGRRQMDGAEAEDHLAELVGCAMSDRGGARPDTLGIPGLLWIEQGTSQHLDLPLENARDRIDSVLRQQLSGIATTGGDSLMERLETARGEILTEKTNRPKGAHDSAVKSLDALRVREAELGAKIHAYREKVDRLDQLSRDAVKRERERPWDALRTKKAEAETRLATARDLEKRRDAEAHRMKSIADQMRILTEQLGTYEREETDAARRSAEHQQAKERATAARASVARLEGASMLAQASADAARATLARARAAEERRRIETDLARVIAKIDAATTALAQAEHHRKTIGDLRAEAARIAVPEPALRRIETLSTALRDARIKRDAIATGLSFDLLPGRSIRVDGTTLSGSRQITLTAEASIDLPEFGTMTIRPGGADLPALAAQIARQEDELRDLLAGIGETDPAAAQARARRAETIASELASQEKLLSIHAPQGTSALAAEIAAKQDDLSRARADLDRLPPADPSQEPPPALAAAEPREIATRKDLDVAADALQGAKTSAARAEATAEQMHRDLENLLAVIAAPERAERKAGHTRDLAKAKEDLGESKPRLARLDADLAATDIATLERDIDRFGKSADEAESGWRTLRGEIMKLETVLETEGAAGLEEQHAETRRDLGAAERRVAEFARRAAALDLILDLMRQKRAALSRRILAPLQARLDHYLRLALPGLVVELDESLAPASVHRPGTDGGRGGKLDEYSIGAREQLGILLRLAYADLLREAGRPTLLILDDALVHSDADRLGGMKRALYDAAARHQILIFTCHPDAWIDLGVGARAIPRGEA